MTVSNTSTINRLNTNGVTVDFPFTFYITDQSQVKALLVDADGVSSEYLNFTVAKAPDNNGGTLTTGDVLDDVEIVIYRDTPLTQETDYVKGGRFPADSHEAALDKLTLQNQEQQEVLDRAMVLPIGEREWDARGSRIVNVGGYINPTDAVNADDVASLINDVTSGSLIHNLTQDRNAVGAHDQIYRRQDATLAQLAAGEYAVGSKLQFSELGGAEFNVVAGGTPNGYDILDAGGGDTAQYVVRNGVIYSEHIGAVHDGVTDDEPAYQALATLVNAYAAITGGVTVKFKGGKSRILSKTPPTVNAPQRFQILADGVTLEGDGTTEFYMDGVTTDYILGLTDFASSGRDVFTVWSFAGVKNCHAKNYGVSGNYTDLRRFIYTAPRAIGTAFKGCSDCTYENLWGYDVQGNVVNINDAYLAYDGVPYSQSYRVNGKNIYCKNTLENGVNYMGGTNDCRIEGLFATECGAAGLESGCFDFFASGLQCIGNKSSGCSFSGKNQTVVGAVCRDALYDQQGVDTQRGYGIIDTGSDGLTLIGCELSDNASHGLYVYPQSKNIRVDGGSIKNNAATAPNKYDIYSVGTAVDRPENITITDVEFDSASGVSLGIFSQCVDATVMTCKGAANGTNSFVFTDSCTGSSVKGNKISGALVSMSDPTGENYDNGRYKRVERTSIPTSGSWDLGDRIIHPVPSPGGISEWVVHQSGTLGTLNGGATTGSITVGTDQLTLSSVTGVYVGVYLSIAGVSGRKKVKAISGLVVTIDSNADATVSGAAVSYPAPVINAVAQSGMKTSIAANPDFVGQLAVAGGIGYMATSTGSPAGWKQITA